MVSRKNKFVTLFGSLRERSSNQKTVCTSHVYTQTKIQLFLMNARDLRDPVTLVRPCHY